MNFSVAIFITHVCILRNGSYTNVEYLVAVARYQAVNTDMVIGSPKRQTTSPISSYCLL